MNDQDDTRLDDALRHKLGAYRPAPSDAVWAGIEARLGATPPPPPRRAGLGAVVPALLTGVLGVALGWWLPHPGAGGVAANGPAVTAMVALPVSASAVSASAVSASAVSAPAGEAPAGAPAAVAAPVAEPGGTDDASSPGSYPTAGADESRVVYQIRPAPRRPARAYRAVAAHYAAQPAASPATVLLPTVPTALLALVAAEATVQATPTDSAAAARHQRRLALTAEKRALTRLQLRADSLLNLLSRGAEATVALTAPLPTTGADDDASPAPRAVVVRRAPSLTHRWLLSFTATPERTFLLAEPGAGDSLATLRRHHEAGRAGLSAAVQAEYRLSERVSVAAGAGYARIGTELRLTEQQTTVSVRYSTTTNVNGSLTTVTTTPVVSESVTQTYRVLRPTYHFITLPVLVRYRLTPATRRTRCWADAAVGAQAQLFRGGTQLVSADGRTFRAQRVGAGAAPFRPATLALTGALAVNFALTPRLAASAAPAVRWQTQSLYRAGAGLRQRPMSAGVQLGLHWTL